MRTSRRQVLRWCGMGAGVLGTSAVSAASGVIAPWASSRAGEAVGCETQGTQSQSVDVERERANNDAERGRKPVPWGRARSCIFIFLDGGPSHIDLFDRRPAAPADIRGPFGSIATTVPGLEICEHLPGMSRVMDRLLQVRSLRHTETVHDPAVYQMLTGYKHVSSAGGLKVESTDRPHWGAALAMSDSKRGALPKFIHTPGRMKMESRVLPGQNAGILPAAFDPLEVEVTPAGDVVPPDFARYAAEPPERLAERLRLLADFNYEATSFPGLAGVERLERFREQAAALANSSAARTAFDIERESSQVRDRYGRHRHGQSMLLARRLVEAGARLVTVYWGSEPQDWADGKGPRPANNPWDTHRNHFPLCRDSLLPRADQAYSALIEDLSARGLLDETLVIWTGEFGRTPRISRPWASRDHWPHAFTALLAGAGIRGGGVYGRTDRWAAEVEERPVAPADLMATLFATLGVSPHQSLIGRQGERHRLSEGRVNAEWFGS